MLPKNNYKMSLLKLADASPKPGGRKLRVDLFLKETRMEKQIIAHLKSHGATNIVFDGPWVTFIGRDGKSCYASRSALTDEWQRGQ